jgi:hypothetical protein
LSRQLSKQTLATRPKARGDENATLETLLAEQMLDMAAMKVPLSKVRAFCRRSDECQSGNARREASPLLIHPRQH